MTRLRLSSLADLVWRAFLWRTRGAQHAALSKVRAYDFKRVCVGPRYGDAARGRGNANTMHLAGLALAWLSFFILISPLYCVHKHLDDSLSLRIREAGIIPERRPPKPIRQAEEEDIRIQETNPSYPRLKSRSLPHLILPAAVLHIQGLSSRLVVAALPAADSQWSSATSSRPGLVDPHQKVKYL